MNAPSDLPPPTGIAMSPTPTAEEAVAIVAAAEALWPRAALLADDGDHAPSRPWRFSGRWWSKPLLARRDRPWR